MSTFTGNKILQRGLSAMFVKAWNEAAEPTDIMPFVLETKSEGADEEYGWLGQAPMMKEWTDERQYKALREYSYKLTNKDFEATLAIDRNTFDDDRIGSVQPRIADLARKAKAAHPRKLFFDALVAGTTDLCYDGQPFFSASHSEGASGTQSNLQTGAGTTDANLAADLDKMKAIMKRYKDDVGEPYNEGDFKLGIICPPELEAAFKRINANDFIVQGVTNSLKGTISYILASGRLTDTNDWYLGNISDDSIKPIIRQIRKAAEFIPMDKGEDAFKRKKLLYGVDSREVMGYGLWQKMIKVTN